MKRAGGVAVLGIVAGALSLRIGLPETPIPVLLFGYGGALLFFTGGLNLVSYLLAYPFRLISTPS